MNSLSKRMEAKSAILRRFVSCLCANLRGTNEQDCFLPALACLEFRRLIIFLLCQKSSRYYLGAILPLHLAIPSICCWFGKSPAIDYPQYVSVLLPGELSIPAASPQRQDGQALAESLKSNANLLYLNLNSNHIGDRGAEAPGTGTSLLVLALPLMWKKCYHF